MQTTTRLTLPLPPSANVYWRVWRGRVSLSQAAKDYKDFVRLHFRNASPLTGEVVVVLDVYRARRSGDLDNRIKVTLDALNGILWGDDSQIVEIHARRFDDKSDPRIEVTAYERKGG